MRIMLQGKYQALARMLKLEGEEIVEERPEITITQGISGHPEGLVIGGDVIFPPVFTKLLGLQRAEGLPDVVVFRWFHNGWRSQTLLGFPLQYTMTGDLSISGDVGMACCFTTKVEFTSLFDTGSDDSKPGPLHETLLKMNYNGFVSFGVKISDEAEIGITEIRTGVRNNGFFNMLEGLHGRLSQFLIGTEPDLQESWTAQLLLTRYPYPHEPVTTDKVYLEGLNAEVEKHLWLFDAHRHKQTVFSQNTVIGVTTSWSQSLAEACRRVLRTLRNVDIPQKQFRTDLFRTTDASLCRLDEMGLI